MKCLVTGGAGFIGSHLVDELISKNHEVAVIDDLSGGYLENVNKKATFYRADVRDFEYLDDIFAEVSPEVVYHFAANAAENKAQFSPVDISSRNFDGAIKTLTAAIRHGLRRFVFISSIAVYGEQQTPFLESTPPKPADIYGETKLSTENCLEILSSVHDFKYVIARLHNVYGPRQNMSDPYRNVVTIFMNSLLKTQAYYIYGDGNQKRCFTFIGDLINPLYKCGFDTIKQKIINLGTDRSYTVNTLSNYIQKISGINIKPIYLPERPNEVKQAISDHAQAAKIFGYKDKTTLLQGLKTTWKWAKQKGPQPLKFSVLEIDSKKVPKNWQVYTKTANSLRWLNSLKGKTWFTGETFINAKSVDLVTVKRDFPEPLEAQKIREKIYLHVLKEKQNELEKINPFNKYEICGDTGLLNLHLYEIDEYDRKKLVMWNGKNLTPTQNCIYWKGENAKVNVYESTFSHTLASASIEYQSVFKKMKLPLPHACLAIHVVAKSSDNKIVSVKRRFSTPVYSGHFYGPGGNPLPETNLLGFVQNELFREIKLVPNFHYKSDSIKPLAMVWDKHFLGGEAKKADIVTFVNIPLTFEEILKISQDRTKTKDGENNHPDWKIWAFPFSAETLPLRLHEFGIEMCPPFEGGILHAFVWKKIKEGRFEEAKKTAKIYSQY